jgi:hypothetical protein
MVSGLCCVYCNLYADEKCLKKAEKLKCKKLFSIKEESTTVAQLNYEKNLMHSWIKGNLKLNSVCCVCNEDDCGCAPNLHDYK